MRGALRAAIAFLVDGGVAHDERDDDVGRERYVQLTGEMARLQGHRFVLAGRRMDKGSERGDE